VNSEARTRLEAAGQEQLGRAIPRPAGDDPELLAIRADVIGRGPPAPRSDPQSRTRGHGTRG
jgi:hypothetical protein